MAQTVIGIFNNESEAQKAVQQLVSDGFDREYIDISSDTGSNTDSSYSDTKTYSDSDYNRDRSDDSFGDKIGRFFGNLFGDDDDNVKRYSEVAKRGCLVTVHAQTEDQAERAVDILDLYGAVDVDERSKYFESNSDSSFSGDSRRTEYDTDALRTGDTYSGKDIVDTDIDSPNYRNLNVVDSDIDRTDYKDRDIIDRDRTDEENKFNVIEENLEVGKREVETGGVRVRSRVIEKPVEESLRLRSEKVVVERNPVNRPASEADLSNFREENFELTEHAEVPVVRKEARVVEEVRVGKQVENREETVRDTVRRTDVDVENLKGDDTRNWRDTDLDKRDL